MEDDAARFDLPCPTLAMEDTYGNGREDDVRGRVKTASERLRQRSASSPASSRASGGARVRARVEEEIMTTVKCVFIGTGAALRYYTGAPGDSHLRNTWPSCRILGFVPRPPHAWIVGWSFLLLRVSCGGMSIENGLKGCLCIFC